MSLTSQNKLETNKYELEISVDAAAFEAAVEQAYRKNRNKITVPGFRRGKAPRKMIERLYGEGVFFEDAVNDLYPDAVSDAVKEAGLTLVDRPEVEVTDVSRENGVTIKAVCVTKPEVELSEYKGIKVTKTVKTVSDEDVQAELAKLQDRNARMVDVDDRPAQMQDNTVIDFEGFVDGEPFEGGKGEQFNLTLGSGQFIPGFEEQIVGHKIGDEFDVEVTFPEDYHAEELKGKAAVFKTKLHEIKYKEVPELDDEFAKDVSEFDTLDELKADLKKNLEEQNENQAETDAENKLIDKVVDGMTAEIPEVMFENRVTESVREFEYRLRGQGLDLQTYLQYTGMDMDAFRKGFREQAEKQVKIRLALEKIVELENIQPTEDELNAEYDKMAANYNMEADKVKELVPAEELSLDLAVNKAIDFVKENATITRRKSAAKKPAEKAATAKKPAEKKTTTAKKPAAKKETKPKTDAAE